MAVSYAKPSLKRIDLIYGNYAIDMGSLIRRETQFANNQGVDKPDSTTI
jgi:hypothetical protein